MESVAKPHVDWYTQAERDELLAGMFRLEPQWYLFYYLTMRLGLRASEVYAIEHRQIRREPARLIVDQAVQRGTKTREAKLVLRKNDEAYVVELTGDVLAAEALRPAHAPHEGAALGHGTMASPDANGENTRSCRKSLFFFVARAGFEPATFGL